MTKDSLSSSAGTNPAAGTGSPRPTTESQPLKTSTSSPETSPDQVSPVQATTEKKPVAKQPKKKLHIKGPKKRPGPKPKQPKIILPSSGSGSEEPSTQEQPDPGDLGPAGLIFDPKFLAPSLVFLTNATFKRKGWAALDKEEGKAWGEAISEVAAEYTPEFLKKHAKLLNLIIVGSGIVFKRMMDGAEKQNHSHPGPKGDGQIHPGPAESELHLSVVSG